MKATFFLLFAGLFAVNITGAEAQRRNVLLICIDDLKPVLGCYGDKLVKSPNIDRLAARGVLFERAYCNQAVCAPSRNSLLTGLRPTTTGIYDLGTNFRVATPDAVTLPQYFKQQGYRTEGLGKIFHVGHGNREDPVSWSVPHWKTAVIAYALPESKAPEGLTREEALFDNAASFEEARKLPRGAAFEAAYVPDEAYPDGRLAEETIRRLRNAAEKPTEPFLLAVGFVKPHLPFCAPKKYWDLYGRTAFKLEERRTPPEGAPGFAPQFGGELRQYKDIPEQGPIPDELQRTLIHGYYAAISFMDAQLGRVLDEFDRLKLSENTVIVLWGDHGWHLGDHGIWCKHTNYEQATRIPIVVAGPGIKSSRTKAFVETVDLYPTICELAGLSRPTAAQNLDGSSFTSVLRDPATSTKDAIFHVYPRSSGAHGGAILGRAIRTTRFRLVEWKKAGAAATTAEFELYDYETDPTETRNLAADQPALVMELQSRLQSQGEAKAQISKP